MKKMGKDKSKSEEEKSFLFLISLHEITSDTIWKCYEKGWEIYRFFITLVTGVIGLLVALLTTDPTIQNYFPIISILSGLVFFIGLSIFTQLINVDMDHARSINYENIIVAEISNRTNLEIFLDDKKNLFDRTEDKNDRYSLNNLVKRAIFSSGPKTQLVIINSFAGAISVISSFHSYFLFNLTRLFLLGALIILFLIAAHGIYGSFRGRTHKG
jgi:hypothetical protein